MPDRVIVREDPVVVRVAAPGPQGAASGATYTHVQGVAAAIWTVVHNLGRRPGGVSVVDSTERVVEGDVRYVSDSTVELTFTAPFSGRAYLS